jgi:hypothetical protein
MAYSLSLIIDSFLIFNTITTTPTLDLNYLQYIIIKIVFNLFNSFSIVECVVLDYFVEVLFRVLHIYRMRGNSVNVDLTSNPFLAPFALTKMSSAHI